MDIRAEARRLAGVATIFVWVGWFFVLYSISPSVTLLMAVPLFFVAVVMKALAPRLHRYSTDVQESTADISHRAQESFAGIRVVKGYGLGQREVESFAELSEENRKHQIDLANARGWSQAGIHFSFDVAFLPVLLVGGWAMIDRSLEVGDLFKFIDLGFKVFWPVIALGWLAGLFPRALASAERIDFLLEEEPEIQDPPQPVPLPVVRGALEMRGVSFTYEGSQRPALTWQFAPGRPRRWKPPPRR